MDVREALQRRSVLIPRRSVEARLGRKLALADRVSEARYSPR